MAAMSAAGALARGGASSIGLNGAKAFVPILDRQAGRAREALGDGGKRLPGPERLRTHEVEPEVEVAAVWTPAGAFARAGRLYSRTYGCLRKRARPAARQDEPGEKEGHAEREHE